MTAMPNLFAGSAMRTEQFFASMEQNQTATIGSSSCTPQRCTDRNNRLEYLSNESLPDDQMSNDQM
jgi:hypothetical protein